MASAVLTNAGTRVCFRVNEGDARKLADGFASFEAKDLQNLSVGEALCRVERAEYDFNLTTAPFTPADPSTAEHRRAAVLAHSRSAYARPRAEVEALLQREFETLATVAPAPTRGAPTPPPPPSAAATAPASVADTPTVATPSRERPPPPAPIAVAVPSPGRGGRQHKYLQELIKRWTDSRGYRAEIELAILDGLGSVDVALTKGAHRIACEVSVTTSPEHEVGNVQKCLVAGFTHVVIVSAEPACSEKPRPR